MDFLIEKKDGKVYFDFQFQLIQSCEYLNWYSRTNDFKYKFTNFELRNLLIKNHIPIGSIEFVLLYLAYHYNKIPKPKNIPEELFKFANRNIINGTEKDISGKKFVKSNDYFKKFTEICTSAPVGNYQISELIEINSEWRAFVYKNKLVGLQNYSGEFTIFPNVKRIEEIIKDYKSAPVAYTLDVGINKENTFIIEVHDFFSCGLYGFSDSRILPYMFYEWFNEYIKL